MIEDGCEEGGRRMKMKMEREREREKGNRRGKEEQGKR
jgi:hypothetical protein